MAKITQPANGLIVKEIKSTRDLADYLPRLAPQLARLGDYLEIEQGERGEDFLALNFVATTPAAILAEMRLAQFAPKSRTNARSVYHFLISIRSQGDAAVMLQMGERLLKLLRLDKQRALLVVHRDTDNMHLHIAADARDEHGRTVEINRGFTKYALQHANALLCHEFGRTPEAGLQFYATGAGVFTRDGRHIRDCDFKLITRDARPPNSAKTPLMRRHELETGLQSIQSALAKTFMEERACAKDLAGLVAMLGAQGIAYRLRGSGATISAKGVTLKASQVSPAASPVKLAAHFGLTFLTGPKAALLGFVPEPGFFATDNNGRLKPYAIPTKCWDDIQYLAPLAGQAAADARAKVSRDAAEAAQFPAFEPEHADELQRRINRETGKLKLRGDDMGMATALFRLDRLEDVQRRMTVGTRGRPRKRRVSKDWPLPQVPANQTFGVILIDCPSYRFWINVWRRGDRVVVDGKMKTVMRGRRVVATFSPTLVTLHTMNEDDHRAALRQAAKTFGGDLKIFGDAKFRRQMTRIAAEEGIVLANPELAPFQRWLLQPTRKALDELSKRLDPAVTVATAGARAQLTTLGSTLDRFSQQALSAHRQAMLQLSTRLEDIGLSLDAQRAARDAAKRRSEEEAARIASEQALAPARQRVIEKAEQRRQIEQKQRMELARQSVAHDAERQKQKPALVTNKAADITNDYSASLGKLHQDVTSMLPPKAMPATRIPRQPDTTSQP